MKVSYHVPLLYLETDRQQAHWIRRQATTYYRSVTDLKAYSRWCLTGTPIQNQLDDIGALFAWLRIRPFDSLAVFRKFIATPFDESHARRKVASRHLATLLDSVCLRRTKELLNLPGRRDLVRELELTPAEKDQYKRTSDMMVQAIKESAGTSRVEEKFGMFQARLQLRILCNHGTWQHHFTWARRSILDEHEGSYEQERCSGCKRPLSLLDKDTVHETYMKKCTHVLCSDCKEIAVSQEANNSLAADDCPLCVAADAGAKRANRDSLAPSYEASENYFRQDGHSSKMNALVEDVKKGLEQSKRLLCDTVGIRVRAANIIV